MDSEIKNLETKQSDSELKKTENIKKEDNSEIKTKSKKKKSKENVEKDKNDSESDKESLSKKKKSKKSVESDNESDDEVKKITKKQTEKDIKVEDNVELEVKKSKPQNSARRNKKSVFHIVVNTNQPFKTISKDLKEADKKLQNAIEELFYNSKNYAKILKINPYKKEKYINDKFSPDYIRKIEFNEYSTGISPKMKRLHAHIMITVRHKTLVHVNQAFLTQYFKEVLNLKGPYVHVKNASDAVFNLKEYIREQ